jgi:hypothetical protein
MMSPARIGFWKHELLRGFAAQQFMQEVAHLLLSYLPKIVNSRYTYLLSASF